MGENQMREKMASVQPKNSGGPITKFWEAPDTISALEHVKAWLCKHAKKHVQSDPPTAKSLSQLISQMLQFQEDALGKSAKNPPFPRLPQRLFFMILRLTDPSVTCCLQCISLKMNKVGEDLTSVLPLEKKPTLKCVKKLKKLLKRNAIMWHRNFSFTKLCLKKRKIKLKKLPKR